MAATLERSLLERPTWTDAGGHEDLAERKSPSYADSEGDDCDDADDEQEQCVPPAMPQSRPGHQTGPKGVLADYRHYQKQQQLLDEEERVRSVAELAKQAGGLSLHNQPTFTQKGDSVANSQLRVAAGDEDDEFLRNYRRRKLQQLKRSRPMFGAVREVEEADYVDAIDLEPSSVPVIVHIYANHLSPCRRVNECLTTLAVKYQHAKFLRIAAVLLDFDEVGLPVLLTYKAGKVVSNRTRVSDDLTEIDVDSLESLLVKDGSLSEVDIADPLSAHAPQTFPHLFEDDDDDI